MAGNGGVSSSRGAGASISAAATAVGSAEARFTPQERRSRWRGCLGGLSCFGSQKGGKRIVPASRIPDGNASTNRGNGTQSAAIPNQNTTLTLSLLAPPSSPASFTNSTLPSTAQSPNCFLSISANSPGGPSSTMFATGPYAHETQLVSPPVFSTYTTEPSTAPLTPPPELAHPTTPSSPDVPFARFLSSSLDLKSAGKDNGMPYMSSSYVFQATYPLYPGSPSSSLISPASGTPRTGMTSPFPEREVAPTQWGGSISSRDPPAAYSRNGSSKLFGLDSGSTSRNFMLSPDSSFLCPATSAQFYLDQAQQSSFPSSYPHCGGGKLTAVDAYSSGGSRINKACKQDAEEIEAYRASFGFSADEIITTQNYVEISDPLDYSFTMSPFANGQPCVEECPENEPMIGGGHQKLQAFNGVSSGALEPSKVLAGPKLNGGSTLEFSLSDGGGPAINGGELTFHKTREEEPNRPHQITNMRTTPPSGQSCSDAEIDYRRARSLRDGILAWRSSLP